MKRHVQTLLPIFLLSLLLAAASVLAQDKSPTSTSNQSDAKKALDKLKTLAGSWQGTIMGISINFTIRPASSGTTILHEAHTEGDGPPKHEITMFYLDADRLLATHYCDAGNRTSLEGKMSPDGKTFTFGFLGVEGSKRGGYLKGMVLTIGDANHHIAELDFVMPDGKSIPLRGEFARTKS
ncbi:MAG: hypothetical protein H7Y17_05415 [Chlorobia bacterium]|nr:hypothetical protein [Fimbriimonadaceae bacterium]